MRIQPKAGERPAAGFSWGDYEDVDEPRTLTADDADGEDDGGWGVVRSRRASKSYSLHSVSGYLACKVTRTPILR